MEMAYQPCDSWKLSEEETSIAAVGALRLFSGHAWLKSSIAAASVQMFYFDLLVVEVQFCLGF